MAHTTHADRRPVSRPLDPSAHDPAARLAADFGSLDLFERLAAVREEVDGPEDGGGQGEVAHERDL